MQRFLRRFALLVAGTLSGFDRLGFKGKLCPLYWPEGMNWLLRANHVAHKEFKQYAKEVTARVVETSGVSQAKAQGRPEQAAERFRQAVEIDPQFTAAWNNLGASLARAA
jgi:hypothetical protein